MRLDKTEICFLLDKSGSMAGATEDTIGAFNALINKQKEGVGECRLTLIQFADSYNVVYTGMDIRAVPELNKFSYVADGHATALDYAAGRAIDEFGARLLNMPENERPATVIFVIQTDGMENHSRFIKDHPYTRERVRAMIEHQKSKYSWDIIYLGADLNAEVAGLAYGIAPGQALSYGKGLSNVAFTAMSSGFNCLREAKSQGLVDTSYSFTNDVKRSVKPDNVAPIDVKS